MHLAYPPCLHALHSNTQKQIIQVEHKRIKNPNWQEATSWLFNSVAKKLGTTMNKSSKWPEWDSNPGARFSKAPIINGSVKLLLFTFKIEFNSFASNMIKLSVSETKWSSLLASTRALIPYISIWIFDFGPKKLPRLSRNLPQDRRITSPTRWPLGHAVS